MNFRLVFIQFVLLLISAGNICLASERYLVKDNSSGSYISNSLYYNGSTDKTSGPAKHKNTNIKKDPGLSYLNPISICYQTGISKS